jgi:hypothetical protein
LLASFDQLDRRGKGVTHVAIHEDRFAVALRHPLHDLVNPFDVGVGGADEGDQALPGFLPQHPQPGIPVYHGGYPLVLVYLPVN